MIHSGLVSITFRELSPEEIIELVAQAGLEGIEWGGDIHVPHGDLDQARRVRRMTLEAGLEIPSYGSYYRVGHKEPVPFEQVLETTIELGTPTVRVWAGKQGSEESDAAYRALVVQESQHIADMAAQEDVTIAYEFHGNTLTDTNDSARWLLEAVDRDNVKTYWQPPRGSTMSYNLEGLEAVLPWLLHIHVFTWHIITGERLPLAEGEVVWKQYLQKVITTGREHFAMVEFVAGDSPENFLRDANTLKRWLSSLDDT